ncbi:MAG: ATP-binding cassette domain-containing protein [Rhodospirillaceae bacterium]|nr:ATP-binding cassette domain-containing protein [Rhodospirillaceae bacterium]MBT6117424.1 ATP-binding cassette domain-containing protein [Rhodospirillaceae bacterium]
MAAEPPILSLRGARIAFGGKPLFEDADLRISRGERLCLVGRNGSGKSTLMKLLAGLLELDAGEVWAQPGIRVAYLPQDPPLEPGRTILDYVAEGTDALHQAEASINRFDLDPATDLGTLSGGEGRRAALARAFAGSPDILLLDEPTNHLDLTTIERLERDLAAFPGGLLLVSHDRTFLTNVSNRTVWLERRHLHTNDAGFAEFDDWTETLLAEEERELERIDKKLAEETRWLHRGVTARRRRNQGRLRRLEDMREFRAVLLGGRRGDANIQINEGDVKSRLVIEAENIRKAYPLLETENDQSGERVVIEGFSTRILRGDRVGLIGPNGAGKTTLLKILTGVMEPDAGRIRLAKRLEIAYFDQHREQLDREARLWDILCPGGGDSVTVQGRQRHVVAYLKDFLFTPDQAKSPVGSLSGGERNRLLLAKILAKPSDLLVLDEPTNDLDMDTLDLLEDLLGDYGGTMLVVSHDRDFLDRIVTSTIAFEPDGTVQEYAGGYRDYLSQRRNRKAWKPKPPTDGAKPKSAEKRRKTPAARMTFKDKHALETLPIRLAALASEIAELEAKLADPGLYARDPELFEKTATRLDTTRNDHRQAEEAWLELEIRREEIESAAPEQAARG